MRNNSFYLSLVFCFIFLFANKANAQWLTAYGFRKPIVINESLISGSADLVDFPLLVSFTDPNFAHTASGGYIENINGYDIDFTQTDGISTLDFEIESYNDATGELVVWVRIPDLSAITNTLLYLYYGNSNISTNPSTTATWNSDYLGVWHLHDNFDDATSKNNDGTAIGTSNIDGGVADGQSFNGSGDYIQTSSNELKSEENFTISVWFKTDATEFSHHLLWQGFGEANGYGNGYPRSDPEMNLSFGNIPASGGRTDDNIVFHLGLTDLEISQEILNIETPFDNTTDWTNVVVNVSNMFTAPSAEMFVNGVSVGADAGTIDSTDRTGWDTDFRMGRPGADERYFDGIMDEVRITGYVLTAEEIETIYKNISDPNSFYTSNCAPGDIVLSGTTIDENRIIGAVAAILSSTDADAGDTHTYTLVAGTGDTDNVSFRIAGNELRTTVVFDYETKDTFYIRLRTTDDGIDNLNYEKSFLITVNDLNESPTDILLSSNTVYEGLPAGTSVGILTSIDPDAGDLHTYSLVAGDGDADNASFQLIGDELQTTTVFDYDAQNVFHIRLSTTDNGSGSLIFEKEFIVNVELIYVSPIANNDILQLDEDQQITVNVLDNDQNPDNEVLTVNVIGQPASNGDVFLSNTGELTYTPDPDYFGDDSLSYSVCIEGVAGYCATARVLITIDPVNDKPVAENLTIEVNQTETVEVCLAVTDIDSDECSLIEIIGNNNSVPFSNWNNDLLCFEYEIPQEYSLEENLECVVCDNGSPMQCDTAILTMIYQIEAAFQITGGISPNGDGVNDTWIIHGIEDYPDNNIKIFNRWGNLIYEVNNYDNIVNVWDGAVNRGLKLSKMAPYGTYFYILELKNINQVKKGYIILN